MHAAHESAHGTNQTSRDGRVESAFGGRCGADVMIAGFRRPKMTQREPRKPVVNFGWIGATTAFGYRFIDLIGVEFPCVISAALETHSSNLS
jgi:hypothetical protein